MSQDVLHHAPEPIRRGQTYDLGRNVFVAYSPKAKRTVKFYSLLHFRHWVMREGDPNLVALCEYPKTGFSLPDSRAGAEFEFALWTRAVNGDEVYWDLPRKEAFYEHGLPLDRPRYWSWVELWCREHAFTARFETNRGLDSAAIFIDNWLQALPYVQHAQRVPQRKLEESIAEKLDEERATQLSEFPLQFPGVEAIDLLAAVFHLLHQGKATANFHEHPLAAHTLVRLVNVRA